MSTPYKSFAVYTYSIVPSILCMMHKALVGMISSVSVRFCDECSLVRLNLRGQLYCYVKSKLRKILILGWMMSCCLATLIVVITLLCFHYSD